MKMPKEYNYGKVRPILQAGDEILFNKIPKLGMTKKEMTSGYFLKYYWSLAVDMLATSYHLDGAGLAAPQIGSVLPIFVLTVHPTPRYPTAPDFPDIVVVNPTILWESPEQVTIVEGCLSIPGFYAGVSRPKDIEVQYMAFDPHSKEYQLIVQQGLTGFVARVFLHELDHLNGILFPQRVSDWTLCATEENRSLLREKIKKGFS